MIAGTLLGTLLALGIAVAAWKLGLRLSRPLALALGLAGTLGGLYFGTGQEVRRAARDARPETVETAQGTFVIRRGERLCLQINSARGLVALSEQDVAGAVIRREDGSAVPAASRYLAPQAARWCPRPARP